MPLHYKNWRDDAVIKITTVCCENSTRHIHINCGKNPDSLILKGLLHVRLLKWNSAVSVNGKIELRSHFVLAQKYLQVAVYLIIVTVNKHCVCYEIIIIVTTKPATSSPMSQWNLSVWMPPGQGGAMSEHDHISCLQVYWSYPCLCSSV